MTDFDFKQCVNCCADLQDEETDLQCAFYTLNWSSRVKYFPNSSSASVERIPVDQALSKIFNFQSDDTHLLSQKLSACNSAGSNVSTSSLPICFVCHLVLNDLYRTYTEFNQLRKTNSYLNKRIKCKKDSNNTKNFKSSSVSSSNYKGKNSQENNVSCHRNNDVAPLQVPLTVKMEVFESGEEELYDPATMECDNIADSELDRQKDTNLSVQMINSRSSLIHDSPKVMLEPSQHLQRQSRRRKSVQVERDDTFGDYSSFSTDPTGKKDDTDIDPLDLLSTAIDSNIQDQASYDEVEDSKHSAAFKTDQTNHLVQDSGSNRFYLLSPDGQARLFDPPVIGPPLSRILSSRIGKKGELKIIYHDHFDFLSGGGTGKATCKLCYQIVARKKGSTASMRSHLFRRHQMIFPQIAPHDATNS